MKLLLKQELIKIPDECTILCENKILTINGKKHTRTLNLTHFNLTIDIQDNNVRVRLWNGVSKEQSKVQTCASIIKNAINGCMKGYLYLLKAASNHFPIGMEIEDNGKTVVVKNFLGEKYVRKFAMCGESVAKLGDEKDTLVIEGMAIEDVSQSAGRIIDSCHVKKYDCRVFLDGLYILKKGLVSDD